ncbi:MAG: LytR C-terminal domain-containing protein, partial [Miltoncostaeaceae bacterium]
ARQAAAAKAAEKEARRSRGRADEAGAGDADDSAGRGLVLGAIAIVVIGLLGAGGWYLFIRDDGSAGTPTTAQSTTQASTGTTTTDSGIVPEDVPPLANKAAYTVAVLNASNVTGAAANKVAPRVQADGYTLGVVDNASEQGLTESQVQYVKGRKEVGWNLAKDLGITRAVAVDSLAQGRIGTADAVVIVGTDLAK